MRSPFYHLAYPLLTFAGLLLAAGAPFVLLARSQTVPFSRIAGSTGFLTGNGLTLAASACLLLGVAALAGHQGRGGRGPHALGLIMGLAGAIGALYWTSVNVFIAPWLGEAAPAVLDDSRYTTAFLIGWLGATALYALGMAGLAIAGFRARIVPLLAAILLALDAPAAFLIGADFPGLMAGAGLLWTGAAGLVRLRTAS